MVAGGGLGGIHEDCAIPAAGPAQTPPKSLPVPAAALICTPSWICSLSKPGLAHMKEVGHLKILDEDLNEDFCVPGMCSPQRLHSLVVLGRFVQLLPALMSLLLKTSPL